MKPEHLLTPDQYIEYFEKKGIDIADIASAKTMAQNQSTGLLDAKQKSIIKILENTSK